MHMFHITNGDCSLHRMRKAGVKGEILPWRDVLHDGPVISDNQLESVSTERAKFIASAGWGVQEEIQHSLEQRDRMLASARDYDRIVLWFELDLYDQLQILQLLNWFADQSETHNKLYLICHHDYLGSISTEEMASLIGTEQAISTQQLKLAQRAWQAFTDSTPQGLVDLYYADTSALTYLHAAIGRLLAFFPAPGSGLNRTEHHAISAIARGMSAADVLFEACQQADGIRFMGDSSFWIILEELSSGEHPLLLTHKGKAFKRPSSTPYPEDFRAMRLRLTDDGRATLTGDKDSMALRKLDRWIGGIHLTPNNLWRWDAIRGQMVR